MATVSKWTPFGVALDLTATGGTVTRTSATQFTVKINVSWETYYSGAQTNYGMTAASGSVTHTISAFDGAKRSSGSGSFTGTYSISGNGAATKSITVTFRNFNTDNGDSATKAVSFNVSVPAWTSYTISYNANGGSGAPGSQTKWRDQTLKLSTTKPTRTGYSFQGWSTSSTATSATYSAGGNYTANAAATLYAVWKANTYTVKYNANGGTGAPGNQTKTYGVTLKLSTTKPTRENYNFLGWSTSASATTIEYSSGANYTKNSGTTLYAVWELAYVRPRINNLTVVRCDSSGTITDEGTNASVTFDWTCDRPISSIVIEWESISSGINIKACDVVAGAVSGSESVLIGGDALSVESTYLIRVHVVDEHDGSIGNVTLPGLKLAIDIIPENRGIAFGKPAELDDVADFSYQIYPRKGFKNVPIEENSDFNLITTPNTYVSYDKVADTYLNGPDVTGTFTLDVASAGNEGQIRQLVTYTNKTNPIAWIRYFHSGSWGEWICIWRTTGAKVLWGGDMTSGMYMTEGHTANLLASVSNQQHGIVLVFSYYNGVDDTNYNWQSFFVPKYLVETSTSGHTFTLNRQNFTAIGTKYLYISDTSISGHASNSATGTTNGITYANNKFVLRYVIGV